MHCVNYSKSSQTFVSPHFDVCIFKNRAILRLQSIDGVFLLLNRFKMAIYNGWALRGLGASGQHCSRNPTTNG